MDPRDAPAGGALAATFELFDIGVRLMRQNLRRQYPTATEHEIDRHLHTWLEHRPGAELGDGPGKPVDAGRIG